jgi:nucleotide-binding universal stress UspA family protein
MLNDLRTRTDNSGRSRPPEISLRPLRMGPLPSAAFATEWAMEQTAGTAAAAGTQPVFIVVGFDGSEAGERALDAGARLLHDREGALEVVYATRDPDGQGHPEQRLAHKVRERLLTTERRWHFQRRDGAVTDQLIAVAEELRREHGPEASIILVVGGTPPTHEHVDGSVVLDLARADRFPLVVVP